MVYCRHAYKYQEQLQLQVSIGFLILEKRRGKTKQASEHPPHQVLGSWEPRVQI